MNRSRMCYRDRQAQRQVVDEFVSLCQLVSLLASVVTLLCVTYIASYGLAVGTGAELQPRDQVSFDWALWLGGYSLGVAVVTWVASAVARWFRV